MEKKTHPGFGFPAFQTLSVPPRSCTQANIVMKPNGLKKEALTLPSEAFGIEFPADCVVRLRPVAPSVLALVSRRRPDESDLMTTHLENLAMEKLEKRLESGETLVVDGAMGTLLHSLGLQPGDCPELWCLTHPDQIRSIHHRYREAGSDVVECNSFGGSRYKLRHYGLENRVAEINRAAAALAREVAGDTQHVLGSLGPTGEFMEPYGDETEEAFFEAFAEQAKALEAGGADAVIVETMTSIEECCVAVRAVRSCTQMTVVASFTFDPLIQGGYASMMGVHPEAFALAAAAAGAHIVGSNCGLGPDHMINIVRELRGSVPTLPLLAMPNAGMPELVDGKTVFRETPEGMAAKSRELRKAGASLIGGCCGTTPAHIAAMAKALRLS